MNCISVESLKRAFQGAYEVYCVTFFWGHLSPEKELAQAKSMAEAAKHAGLKHVIWSTLEDTRKWVPLTDDRMPTLLGKYKVPHFDAKGGANQIFTDLGVPTTFLLTSLYWDNLISGFGPKKGPDGKLVLTLPMADKELPGIFAEDIGRCVYGIFKKGREYIGRTVGIAGGQMTGGQMTAALTKALGEEVRYNYVPPEVYPASVSRGAEDVANMFQFKRDFEQYFCGALNPSIQTFDQWLARNKDRIPLV